jgi:hypothetical protein
MTCPTLLYRAFTDLCHARQFADAGRFRIGRLDCYQNIENAARMDAAEGHGYYIDKNGISENFELGNVIYVLCCSAENVDLAFLRRKMGSFLAQINDPKQLACDIAAYLKAQKVKLLGEVRYRAVEYSKGETVTAELDEMKRAELSIAQKHSCFSEEKEQRLCAIVNVHCPKPLLASYLEIDLGRRLPYVEIL